MKKIFLALGCFMVFGIGTVNAQNVLNEMAYGFETEVKEKPVNWWIVPAQRDKVMVTKDKAASGDYSLKISCQDFGNIKTLQCQSIVEKESGSKINLNSGTYTVSLKVYADDVCPMGFSTNILATKDTKFIPIKWNLKGVEKNKWVELKQDITFPDLKDAKMSIAVSSNPKWGGVGTIYVDDINISKK